MNGEDKKNLFTREELKQRLQQIEAEIQAREEFTNIPVTKVRKNHWKVCLLAVLVAGLVAGYLLRDQHDERLFSQYYEPYPNVITYLEQSQTPPAQLKAEALQLYENGHYAEALAYFESFPASLKRRPDILFYAGISCIETDQLDKAEAYLQEATRQPDRSFVAQSQWYLALIHLKKSERRQARKQLKMLTRFTEVYKDKASQLLKEL